MDLTYFYDELNSSLIYKEDFLFKSKFELLVKLILSSRASGFSANKIGDRVVANFPNLSSLSKAHESDLQNLIHDIGFFKQKTQRLISASKFICKNYNSNIPEDYSSLIKIPGMGDKSSKKFLTLIKKNNFIMVDTHMTRVLNRIGFINQNQNNKLIEYIISNNIPEKNHTNFSNLFSFFGKSICKAKKPKCHLCSFKNFCNFIN